MWKYNNTDSLYHGGDELAHYGVPGMKWGKRSRSSLNRATYKQAKNKAFANYEKGLAKIESPYKRGQKLSKKDMGREAALEKKYASDIASAKKAYKSEKKAIRGDINAAARRQRDSSSFGERLLYSSGTDRRAGKLMVERGMSEIDAKSQAKKEAWRNTGILVAGLIGVGVAAKKRGAI